MALKSYVISNKELRQYNVSGVVEVACSGGLITMLHCIGIENDEVLIANAPDCDACPYKQRHAPLTPQVIQQLYINYASKEKHQ